MPAKGPSQPKAPARKSTIGEYQGKRVRLTLNDGRSFNGLLKAFDRHMNLVISDATIVSAIPPPQKARRLTEAAQSVRRIHVGLAVIRGIHVLSVELEMPWQPKVDEWDRFAVPAVPATSLAPRGLAGAASLSAHTVAISGPRLPAEPRVVDLPAPPIAAASVSAFDASLIQSEAPSRPIAPPTAPVSLSSPADIPVPVVAADEEDRRRDAADAAAGDVAGGGETKRVAARLMGGVLLKRKRK